MTGIPLPPRTLKVVNDNGTWTEDWYKIISQLARGKPDVGCQFKTVNHNTAGIGSASQVAVGVIPSGALHTQTYVRIRQAFNAGSSNTLIVGTSSDADHYVEAGDITPASTGLTASDRNVGEIYASDTKVYAQYTQTGTPSTQGIADIVLIYATET